MAKMLVENFMKSHHNSLKSLFQRNTNRNHHDVDMDALDSSSSSPTLTLSLSPASIASIPQLSLLANSVVARSSKILGISPEELQHRYDIELAESVKQQQQQVELTSYARNLVEFCFFKAIHLLTTQSDYLSHGHFRRFTYDAMLAWEAPTIHLQQSNRETASCSNQDEEDEDQDGWSLFYSTSTNMAIQVDDTKTVGLEAFTRIAPACTVVADVITVHNLFDALTSSSGGRLHFLIYDKYLRSLDKVIRAAKKTPGTLISNLQLAEGEFIVDVDGAVPTQPVLQHIGISAWPGRLTLTNYALYFESFGVSLYDKPVRYDLAMDMKQVVKPELTGPLGARLFDKAVMYKSTTVVEPVFFEFPEFKGNFRRDYWLDICLEILNAHRFIRKNKYEKTRQLEVLARATLSILRYRAAREAFHFFSSSYKTLLAFKLAESLPRGDMILEALSSRLALLNVTAATHDADGFPYAKWQLTCSPVALLTLIRLGFTLPKVDHLNEEAIAIGDLCAGETNPLEIAVKQSISDTGRAEAAQETVNKVKVEGIDTNVAVMKELLFPVIELATRIQFLASWEDPFRSIVFLSLSCYTIQRGWTRYMLPSILICCAVFMFLRRYFSKGKPLEALRVKAPPSKNAVEQLLTLQEAITQVEAVIQAGNIILLKLRALLFSILPQATERVALLLVVLAAVFAFMPLKHLILSVFLEAFTRQMPYRKESSDRLLRRLREWWIRIPAAPVQLTKIDGNKKTK